MPIIRSQKGISLIIIIVMILVLGMVIAAMVSMVNTESYNAMHQQASAEADYAAKAGIEKALYRLKTGTGCSALAGSDTLGGGSITTTATPYNLSTAALSAAISSTDTTIPVDATTSYADWGRIKIESEEIAYASKTATSFTGAQRGVGGTTAAGHLSGQSATQNQCFITATGTVNGPIVNTQRVIEVSQAGGGGGGGATSTKYGSFTKATGAAPVSQSITGVGFQPKGVIFFWTRQTAEGFASDLNAGVGFATGPANERAVSVTALSGDNRNQTGRRRSESNMILLLSGGPFPTLIAQAELTSFDADGFTINWTTNDANAYLIHYIALGGDITNALAGTFTLTRTVGNQAVTGVGFQPDSIMTLWGFTEPVDTSVEDAAIGIGFARSATARGAMVYASPDNKDYFEKRWQQRTDAAILLLAPDDVPPTQDAIVDLVSMDADGFTVNKSDDPKDPTPIFFLALKGGRHNVGAFNQPTVTGNQATTGVGFQPEQLILAGFNLAATQALSLGGAVSFGAAGSSTERGGIWFQDSSDFDPIEANMYTATSDTLTLADGPSTVDARADFVQFDPDGFTLNWQTADATARQTLYWAVAPNLLTLGGIDWREVY
ncbi:MAG: hypothetical protein ACE5HN_02850 [Nitrospiria bacterium]